MKNKKYQAFRISQRNPKYRNECSRKKPHTNHILNPNQVLSWWDDVAFIMGDYRVAVAWVHPRTVYSDQIGTVAQSMIDEVQAGIRREPVYKTVGKSRKKAVLFKVDFSGRIS